MSYGIESKKRKFERILESLTDGNSPQPRASLNSRNNTANATIFPSFGSDSSKRRRITPVGSLKKLVAPSSASLTVHYLPSSRLAFLERLESFRQVTKWHIPSTSSINAVEWAKRGWICENTDTVSCPSCKQRVHVDIDLSSQESGSDELENDKDGKEEADDDDPLEVAHAVLQGLMKRYQEMITTSHTDACPWRRRGCDSSIQRIEGLLNTSTAITGLETRYKSIVQDPLQIPKVEALPLYESRSVNEKELSKLQLSGQETDVNVDALKLAMCGWQRKENDIIECRHCFRSLGLWLYRGINPTIHHLDAVDNHLEYCPWLSAVAQNTEIALESNNPTQKQEMPGWTLVYLAILKKNHKRRTGSSSRFVDNDDAGPPPELTPEQREKKMKDLMRRIRELKKPFNVKSLLKRKDKSDS